MTKRVFIVWGLAIACLGVMAAPWVAEGQDNSYVGSATCAPCHAREYEHFTKYAKKSKSAQSIKIMASDLTKEELEGCYVCHTTGYGHPSGFKSFESTPEMAHAGCEVCHGPGGQHVEYGGDPSLIKRDLSLKDCESCHNEERVSAFNFKPLLYGGAH